MVNYNTVDKTVKKKKIKPVLKYSKYDFGVFVNSTAETDYMFYVNVQGISKVQNSKVLICHRISLFVTGSLVTTGKCIHNVLHRLLIFNIFSIKKHKYTSVSYSIYYLHLYRAVRGGICE